MTADATTLAAPAERAADTHAAGSGAADTHAAGSGGIGNPILGMLLFITSEVMFFAGLFAAYFSIRAGYTEVLNGVATHVWPPAAYKGLLNPFEFTTPTGALNLILPATIILILSSVTCQMGVWAIRRNDRRGLTRAFAVTLVLGITFLLLQAFDYSVLMHEGLFMGATTFGTTYFTLTGFHGAHVFGGVLMLAVVLYRGMAGQFSAKHHDMVEAASLYWHFVDVVWVLLFSILYLL
jgi:cytochrome c oxidase subunit III